MRFRETKLAGAYLIEPERLGDERGFFARTFCRNEFESAGLPVDIVQCNISFNSRRGTLRGMHFQRRPHPQQKLVRCTSGALYDVIVDLRPDSATFRCWAAFELTPENSNMLFIPEGVGHGFQTLADNTEVFYHMFEFYRRECDSGFRYDDPAFGISWPLEISCIANKDLDWQPFTWTEDPQEQ